jgi:hypothetical protein
VSGDISTDYHATKTNLYAGKPWNCRLIFGWFLINIAASSWMFMSVSFMNIPPCMKWFPLCRMLSLVSGIIQLDPANLCYFLAHQGAYKAGILHRDFSVGNIIIDSGGNGWLINWDSSSRIPCASLSHLRFL